MFEKYELCTIVRGLRAYEEDLGETESNGFVEDDELEGHNAEVESIKKLIEKVEGMIY